MRRYQQNQQYSRCGVLHLRRSLRDSRGFGLPIQVSISLERCCMITDNSIMGWSAFAGVVVLAVATPINSFISKRQIKVSHLQSLKC